MYNLMNFCKLNIITSATSMEIKKQNSITTWESSPLFSYPLTICSQKVMPTKF